jgi:glycosyltransferase involved in cell wall biosynthesis
MVIQEAFFHGRPVICAGIGGMAEKVRDGVDGLHFRVGDAVDLAGVMQRAVTQDDLWQQLADKIKRPPGVSEVVKLHLAACQADQKVQARSLAPMT